MEPGEAEDALDEHAVSGQVVAGEVVADPEADPAPAGPDASVTGNPSR